MLAAIRAQRADPATDTEADPAPSADARASPRVHEVLLAFDGRIITDPQMAAGLRAVSSGASSAARPSEPDDRSTPFGWSRESWRDRLRQIADRCEGLHPDRAADLRAKADRLDVAESSAGV